MSFRPRRPEIPPPWPPFILPFDPPGSEPPPLPPDSDPPEGSSTDDSTSSSEPRPDWWPDDWPWPPEPEEPVEILAPPPIHTWPRLPPDHPYHVPPGYSAPDNLPPGHPGEYYPDMPPDPVMYPVEDDTGSVGDESQSLFTLANTEVGRERCSSEQFLGGLRSFLAEVL